MFEVKCIVHDSDVAKAIRLLHDIALEPPVVIPVGEDQSITEIVQDIVKIGEKHAKSSSKKAAKARLTGVKVGGSSTDFLLRHIRKGNLTTITTKEADKILKKVGFGKNVCYYAFEKLRECGFLKKSPTNGQWDVLPEALHS